MADKDVHRRAETQGPADPDRTAQHPGETLHDALQDPPVEQQRRQRADHQHHRQRAEREDEGGAGLGLGERQLAELVGSSRLTVSQALRSLALQGLVTIRPGAGAFVLRNPASGKELGQLTAVVLLFNHDGGFVASGRAAVEAPKLEPGGETTFVITIPGAADVERYRVSFRIEDRVVPHVDVRG